MALQKPTAGGKVGKAASSQGFMVAERAEYPWLFEYMNTTAWDDGTARETATLMLLVEDGWLKACLNDRAGGRSLWVTGSALVEVLGSLEGHLAAGTGDWRVKRPFGSQGGKKKS